MDTLWNLLERSQVYDLGQALEPNAPVSPNHPGFRLALMRRHGDMVRADGGSAANEMFTMGGHVGTHMDALAHVSQDGKGRAGGDRAADDGKTFSEIVLKAGEFHGRLQ